MIVATNAGFILNSLNAFHKFSSLESFAGVISQVRHYAVRKGTREKAKKKKAKKVEVKLTFLDKIKRSKRIKIIKPEIIRFDDSFKVEAVDDVYASKDFKWKVYPFAEAIQCHREYFHPTMFNAPESLVNIFVELNFQGVKKSKPVEAFNKIVSMKNPFDHGEERNIVVFCNEEALVKDALDNGAALAGGSDIIKLITNGEISVHNYDTFLGHPNILPEILVLRGLLKKKHPSIKAGTLGTDIKSLVHLHMNGIKYSATPCDDFPEYGVASIPIGTLNMEITHLEENMQNVLDSVMEAKPNRPGSFVQRIRVECKPSKERFKVDHRLYVTQEEDKPEDVRDDDSDDEDENAEAVSV